MKKSNKIIALLLVTSLFGILLLFLKNNTSKDFTETSFPEKNGLLKPIIVEDKIGDSAETNEKNKTNDSNITGEDKPKTLAKSFTVINKQKLKGKLSDKYGELLNKSKLGDELALTLLGKALMDCHTAPKTVQEFHEATNFAVSNYIPTESIKNSFDFCEGMNDSQTVQYVELLSEAADMGNIEALVAMANVSPPTNYKYWDTGSISESKIESVNEGFIKLRLEYINKGIEKGVLSSALAKFSCLSNKACSGNASDSKEALEYLKLVNAFYPSEHIEQAIKMEEMNYADYEIKKIDENASEIIEKWRLLPTIYVE